MNKYRRWHNELIARARYDRHLIGYTEHHHIKPRCLGGSNKKSNLVTLTYREHFLVHWLLIKLNKGEARRKLQRALWRMVNRNTKQNVIATDWQYEVAKRAHRRAMIGNQLTKGHTLSPDHIAKLRDHMPWNTGCKTSQATRAKLSVKAKEHAMKKDYINPMQGRKRPDVIARNQACNWKRWPANRKSLNAFERRMNYHD
jgi:hypothetical protein